MNSSISLLWFEPRVIYMCSLELYLFLLFSSPQTCVSTSICICSRCYIVRCLINLHVNIRKWKEMIYPLIFLIWSQTQRSLAYSKNVNMACCFSAFVFYCLTAWGFINLFRGERKHLLSEIIKSKEKSSIFILLISYFAVILSV